METDSDFETLAPFQEIEKDVLEKKELMFLFSSVMHESD